MADIIDVSQAMADRLGPVLPDWEPFWFRPSKMPTYAMVIEPDLGMFADYQQVNGSYARWYLRVVLYARATDQETARLAVGRLVGPKGLIIRTLTDEDIDDALFRLCRYDIRATTGKGWAPVYFGLVRYLSAGIGFVLGSN